MSDNSYERKSELSKEEERIYSAIAHAVGIPFEFFGPLVGYLLFKDRGPFVSHHVKESLNFGITMSIIVVAMVITIVGIMFLWVVPILWTIFRIVAAVKAYQGQFYRYPINFRFLK